MKNFKEKMSIEDEKNMAMKVLKIIGMVILGIGVCILLGFVIMWLWNWLMPMLFGLAQITYWQAVGIFILAKIIFGGIGGGGGSDDSKKKHKGPVRREIEREVEKEIQKEFDKKHRCEEDESEDENKNYDAMYEQWWAKEGEKNFGKYMDDQD